MNETEREYAIVYDFTRSDPIQAYPPAKAVRITGSKYLTTVQAYDRRNAVEKAKLSAEVNDAIRRLQYALAP